MVGNEALGKHLRALREGAGLSLRDVQDKSNDIVKNSYLSQIEGGRIGQPSPNVLWELARVYNADYNDLLTRAGHRVAPPATGQAASTPSSDLAFSLVDDLTEEEQRTVMEYIEFVRSKRDKGSTDEHP